MVQNRNICICSLIFRSVGRILKFWLGILKWAFSSKKWVGTPIWHVPASGPPSTYEPHHVKYNTILPVLCYFNFNFHINLPTNKNIGWYISLKTDRESIHPDFVFFNQFLFCASFLITYAYLLTINYSRIKTIQLSFCLPNVSSLLYSTLLKKSPCV